MRRFVNADIVAGAISEAVTLNRFAYANGNPVSNIDPFGLAAERTNAITYKGRSYDIFVPSYSEIDNLNGWNQVGFEQYVYVCEETFDWANFMVQMVMGPDDMDDIATGKNPNFSQEFSGLVAWYSLFTNTLSAVGNSIKRNTIYITFSFQELDGKRRVIITTGDTQQAQVVNQYAGKSIRSTDNCRTMGEVVWSSTGVEHLYKDLTGNNTGFWDIYSIRVTVDEKHKNSKDFYYLWMDDSGALMTSPVVYENDKVEIGEGYLFFNPLLSLPINGTGYVSQEYTNIFQNALDEKELDLN